MHIHAVPSIRKMAERIGVSGPTLTNALNREEGIGLDFAVKLHRSFHVSLDVLVDSDPPSRQS
jgi:plasmid maintenance system antidote protein VapI